MRRTLIFILTAIMLLMTACSSGGDKIKLTGGYVIWKTDSRTVICGRDNDGVVENVVGDYVTEYRYGDRYIFVKCADVPEDPEKQIDFSAVTYYIIDTADGETQGPLDEKVFDEVCTRIEEKNMTDWRKTK